MNVVEARSGQFIHIGEGTKAHLAAHPEALGLLAEAASHVTLPLLPYEGEVFKANVEFGRIIGRSGCVSARQVSMHEATTFAVRKGRNVASRVVMGEGPEVSTFALICGFHGGAWRLYTGFVGDLAPREPHDKAFLMKHLDHPDWSEAMHFWAGHALVWDEDTCGEVFTSTWYDVIKDAASAQGFML